MKKLTKLIKLALILIVALTFPLQGLACPHVDKDGVYYFQFYNEDYTIMTMMYPRKNYLYSKDVPLDDVGVVSSENEDTIINESFGFPLAQDKTAYFQNYWFVDEKLESENWKELDIKTTIEGLNDLLVSGKNFNLNVGLMNTFNKSKKHIDKRVYQMYYNIYVDRLNDNNTETKYSNLIKQYEFDLIVPEILQVNTEYLITYSQDYGYEMNNIKIKKLYDDIEVQIMNDNNNENTIALNLDKKISESNFIECNYNSFDNLYSFTINEPGVYVILNKDLAIDMIMKNNETIKTDENFDKSNDIDDTKDILKIFVYISALIVPIIIFIIFKRKKRK